MKKQQLLWLALIITTSCNLKKVDEQPVIIFKKTFGGGNQLDQALSVIQTTDGGYAVAGFTESVGSSGDFYLVKTDADGDPEWKQNIGGPDFEIAYSVAQLPDGGFLMLGETVIDPIAFERQMQLVRTNSSGVKLLSKTYPEGNFTASRGKQIKITKDGGAIMVGNIEKDNSNMYLVKIDANGVVQWEKDFNGSSINTTDFGNDVFQTSDGGYILVGQTYSNSTDASQVFLVKTDANGNQTNRMYFGGTGYESGSAVLQTSDGGYIIAGVSSSSTGNGAWDMYLLKTYPDLTLEWESLFGGAGNDIAKSVDLTADGGYVLVGDTESTGDGVPDIFFIKTDSKGKKLIERTFGNESYDYGHSVKTTNDGGFVIAGDTYLTLGDHYDMFLIKTDKDGKSE